MYRERAPEIVAHPETTRALAAELRQALHGRGLEPIAQRSATEMVATLELEQGRWGGRVVDGAVLDERAARHDEAMLVRFAARLPDLALRAEARRRVIRLRIAASEIPEVHDDAAHVEEVVMQFGMNPVSPRLQEPQRATLDASRLPIHGVVVKQDVPLQTAALADAPGPPREPTMIGPLALRGALSVEVAGLSRPITLCGPARALDPTPCLLPGDVVVDSPLVWRDHDGGAHLVESITMAQAVDLARGGPHLSLPIVVGGRPLAALDAPLSFPRPADLAYAADPPDGERPGLRVEVEDHGSRLIYTITHGARVRLAVVERAAARQFQIVSRGADGLRGADGSPGWSGSDGSSGSSASCPGTSGTDGSNGGDGGSGGDGSRGSDGGKGGDIDVLVRCDDGSCHELIAALRDKIRSEGGSGGAGGHGGSGGRGGRGGSGGSGTTCIDTEGHTSSLSGGSDGHSGSDGRSGFDGSPGSDGQPGQVRFRATRAATL